MSALRALIRNNRHLAGVLLVLALLLKAAIPAGFMVSASAASVLTITICSDSSGAAKTMDMALPAMPAKPDGLRDAASKGGHCAFAGLSDTAVGGADGLQLALGLALILVLGLAPARRQIWAQIVHPRPFSRGPPAAA